MLIAIIIILILFGGLGGPWWPYSRGWGYYPVGGVGLLLVVLLLVLAFGAGR